MIPTELTHQLFAIVIAVLGVGRLTRIVTYDDYPPMIWLRSKWARLVKGGDWAKLLTCGWCASPYLAAVCVAHGLVSFGRPWEASWWIFWGILALAYVAAMVFARDEPR